MTFAVLSGRKEKSPIASFRNQKNTFLQFCAPFFLTYFQLSSSLFVIIIREIENRATTDLNTFRAELIYEINQTKDAGFLEKLKGLYAEFKTRDQLSPMTWEELYQRLDEAESDYQNGRITSQDDLEKESGNW